MKALITQETMGLFGGNTTPREVNVDFGKSLYSFF